MKKLLLKLTTLLFCGAFGVSAYAGGTYDVDLVASPTAVSNTGMGYAVYEITNNDQQNPRPAAGFKSLPFGTTQITTYPPNPSLNPICGRQFNLGKYGSATESCFAVLQINGPSFPDGGTVTGQAIICDSPANSGNCEYIPSDEALNIPIVTETATITVVPGFSTLGPNDIGSWTVTNLGPGDAFGLGINLQSISGDFLAPTIPLACGDIVNGGNCVITAQVRNNPTPTPPTGVSISFVGSNTNTVIDTVTIVNNNELVPIGSADININEPGLGYCVEYQNILTTAMITVGTVTLNTGTTNVTLVAPPVGDTACDGDTVNPGGTCFVCGEGTVGAFGAGTYTVPYTPFGGSLTNTGGNVTVAGTSISIIPAAIDITSGTAGSGTYEIFNNGPFNLQGTTAVTTAGGVTLDALPGVCDNLAPSSVACQPGYNYTASPSAGLLTVNGSNAVAPATASISIVTATGPIIRPASSCADGQYLQYQCITIDNSANPSTSFTYTVSLTGAGVASYARVCSTTDSTCEYVTGGTVATCTGLTGGTGTVGTGTIAAGAKCEIWVKSLTPTNEPFGVQGPFTLNVTSGSTNTNFSVYQELALYATGNFNQSGTGPSSTTNNIAKYDGTNWVTLDIWQGIGSVGTDNGLTGGQGNALSVYRGNLYAGGKFITAGVSNTKFLAFWNGTQWNSPVTSAANQINGASGAGVVTSLSSVVNANGISGTTLPIYVGGQFSTAGGSAVTNMAQYVNSVLQPLAGVAGNGADEAGGAGIVYGLFVSGTSLYTSGDFERTHPHAGGGTPNNIALWSQSGSAWSSFNDGINNTIGGGSVNAATTDNSGNLYVTGSFTTTLNPAFGSCGILGSIITDFNVMKYDGTCWTLADGSDPFPAGFAGPGNDIVNYNGTIYAGGEFPCRADLSDFGNTPINNVSYLGGGQWQRLGGGLGGLVTLFGSSYCVPTNLVDINFVNALVGYNNILFAGGFFNVSPAANSNPQVNNLNNVAMYSLGSSTNSWAPVGGGVHLTTNPDSVSIADLLITSSLLIQ